MSNSNEIKIAIVGGGWINKGAEAMTYTAIKELKKRNKNISLSVFVTNDDPYTEKKNVLIDNESIEIQTDDTGKVKFIIDYVSAFVYNIIPFNFFIKYSHTLQKFKKYDAVVDIYGYCLHDDNSVKAILFQLSRLFFVKALGKKYFLFPQSIGPLNSKIKKLLVGRYLRKADKICVRGDESEQVLSKIISSKYSVDKLPDTALLFEKGEESQISQDVLSLRDGGKVFVVSPNINLQRLNKKHIDDLKQIIEYIINSYGFSILLVPHEFKNGKRDDLVLCRELKDLCTGEIRDKISIVEHSDKPSSYYKTCVSLGSFMLASRYHAAVASLSMSIPTVTLGWSEKYRELMRWFLQEEYAVDGLSGESCVIELKQKIDQIIRQSENISSVVTSQMVICNSKLNLFFDETNNDLQGDTTLCNVEPEPSKESYKSILRNYLLRFFRMKPLWFFYVLLNRMKFVFSALHFGVTHNQSEQGNIYTLRRYIHMIEKGLSYATQKPVFAEKYILRTIEELQKCTQSKSLDNNTRVWVVSVLEKYFSSVTHTSSIRKAFTLFQSLHIVSNDDRETVLPYRSDERKISNITYDDLMDLAQRRRSVRSYLDKEVDEHVVKKAMDIAALSPSACNRQSFQFMFFNDPKMLEKISRIPGGINGYSVPAIIVVVGKYIGYSDESNFFVPAIDASLASMSFLFALETLGLSSVCVNWPNSPKHERRLRDLISLEDDEIVVMMIGVGYPDPNGKIPYSAKKDTDTLLKMY